MSARTTLRAPVRPRTGPAAFLAVTVAVAASACAHVIPGDVCPVTQGQEILDRINRVRVGANLEPLVVDERLIRAARAHARSMAENGFFDHVGPDGVEPADRVAATGYAWTFVAENLAAGVFTPTQVVAGWLESPLHRDNMLEPAAAHVGIAYADGTAAQYRGYWTAVFADSSGPPQTPERGCHP